MIHRSAESLIDMEKRAFPYGPKSKLSLRISDYRDLILGRDFFFLSLNSGFMNGLLGHQRGAKSDHAPEDALGHE